MLSLKILAPLLIFLLSSIYLFRDSGCTLWDPRPQASGYDDTAINIADDPIQIMLEAGRDDRPIRGEANKKAYELVPVARYKISGRIVSKKRYYREWANMISPIDLAIAWGDLATSKYDSDVSFSHGNRFIHYHYSKDSPLNSNYINAHSSNNHMIPATQTVDLVLKSVRINEIVEISGFLVNLRSLEGEYTWKTSLSRTDTGGGACELIYAEQVRIGENVYR